MIRDSRLWNLYLALDVDHIDVMAYCPIEDQSLFVATIPLDGEIRGYVESVEEAVYDNPLLLNDFNKVSVIIRSVERVLLPTEIANSEYVTDIVGEMTGMMSGRLIVNELPLLGTSLCFRVDDALYNFLTRTFGVQVKLVHRLTSFITYTHGTQRGAGSMCSHVNLRRSSIDIVIFNGDKLLLANTYKTTSVTDGMYYVMATRKMFDIVATNAVILSGDKDVRDELTALLTQYLPTVIPAVFPTAMFRAGGQTALSTPTDLILMPLCE